ncbi:ATP-binding protein [Streptomyces sp. NBC_00878]|uniref:ATP-binding protein n=1 Tax=Streptomyces sp. NBC_00878 TaxID=2975854 RepID=UPI002B1E137E|nr:ATP-binding protein [Streptomyces sp. NBC_00878]
MVAPQESAEPEAPLRHDRLDYTPLPKSVTLARRRAHRLLTEWGHPELAADTALLVSELGGNAVLHGCLRDRLFRVELTLTESVVRISVSDPKGELRPHLREATTDDMFGRGLLIVGQVADRWGVHGLTVGKSVWCELDVARQEAVAAHCRVPNTLLDIRAALPEERREVGAGGRARPGGAVGPGRAGPEALGRIGTRPVRDERTAGS